MFLVIGSSGNVGRHVVTGLAAGGHKVRAFTRDASRVSFDQAVEVVEGDLAEPVTLLDALSGVDGVFVMSAGPDAQAHELNVAEAVRSRGVARVVKLSSVAAIEPAVGSYGKAHAVAELAFAQSGAEWTALRAAGFMSNVMQWARTIAAEGKVYQAFGAAPKAVVDAADVAAVAVACLTRGGHHGKAYQLTGPEAFTSPQLADKVSAALGRPLEYVEVPPEFAARAMQGAGLPEEYVAGLLAAFADTDPRRGATPLPTVEQITGRPANTFDAWLADHIKDLAPAN